MSRKSLCSSSPIAMLLNGLMKAGVGKRMGSGTNSKGVHILDLTPAPLKMASLPRIPRAASNLKRNTSFLVRCPNANQVDLPSTTA